MKILVLANSSAILYNFRIELLQELVKEHEVYVCAPEDDRTDALNAIGCRFIGADLLDRHGENPLKEVKLIRYYKGVVRRLKPDLLLTYTIKCNIYGGMAARAAGVPYIPNVTGLGIAIQNESLKQHFLSKMYLHSLQGAARVFFQNEANAEFFYDRGLLKEKTEVLPGSGVNLEKHHFEPYPPENAPIVISVIGRIMKDKGTDEVLSAAKMLKSRYGDLLAIRLIGDYDGDYEEKVDSAVNAGLIEHIRNQSDIHPWMKESSAILHASYHEGMSNVLLEAAATGRPVIATDVPGCRETYINGETGIAFPARDANALAAAVEKFLSLPYEKRAEMGVAGRKYVEDHFDRKIVVKAYLDAIRRLTP